MKFRLDEVFDGPRPVFFKLEAITVDRVRMTLDISTPFKCKVPLGLESASRGTRSGVGIGF